MEQKKATLLAAIEAYSQNSSVANQEFLLKRLIQNAHIAKLIRLWKNQLSKALLLANIDILIDIALEEFEAKKEFQTSFKISETGNFFRIYLPTEINVQERYLKNIWLSEVSYIDVKITSNDFLEDNLLKKEKILQHLGTKHRKGLYIYGAEGLGKTFLLQYIVLEHARQGYSAAFINSADLQNFILADLKEKSAIVRLLKTVDILALDDLGAERKSEWFRDSILLDVLQARAQMKKETYFSSNFSMKTLIKVFAGDEANINEFKRSIRLVERIKELAAPWFIEGKNLRD